MTEISHQFVYGKFLIKSGEERSTDFRPVAATPELGDDEMEQIPRRASIGTDVDLESDTLNAFFVSQPDIAREGYRVLSHHMRSLEKAPGRNYYEFTHYMLIKTSAWRELSRNFTYVLRRQISDEVYGTYEINDPNNLKPHELRPFSIEAKPLSIEEKLDAVKRLFDSQANLVLLLLDGILERESVTVRGFTDDLHSRIELIQGIHFLLPISMVDELSFATHVYQNPHQCYARIKFLATDRALTESYVGSNFIVDARTGTANGTTEHGYSSLVAEIANEDERELTRLMELLSKPELFSWTSAQPDRRLRNQIYKPKVLHTSHELEKRVNTLMGLPYLAKRVRSSPTKVSGRQIEEFLALPFEETTAVGTAADYQDLLKLLIEHSLTTDSKVIKSTVESLCKYFDNLDSPEFWTRVESLFIDAKENHITEFISECQSNDCYRKSPNVRNQVRRMMEMRAEKLAESAPENAISLIEKLEKANIFSIEDSWNTYRSILDRVSNFSILAAAIERVPKNSNTGYCSLAQIPNVQSALKRYPNTYAVLLWLAGDTVENIEQTFVKAAEELDSVQGKKAFLFSTLRDAICFGKGEILSQKVLSLFGDSNLFGDRDLEKLLDLVLESDCVQGLDFSTCGSCTYLAWRVFANSNETKLDNFSVLWSPTTIIAPEFISGFCTFASKESRAREACIFLLENANPEDRLGISISLLKTLKAPSALGEIAHRAVEECKTLDSRHTLERKTVFSLLEGGKDHPNLVNTFEDLLPIILREPIAAVCTTSSSSTEDAVNYLAYTIKNLHEYGLESASIADQVLQAQKQECIELTTFASNFSRVLQVLRTILTKKDMDSFVSSIMKSDMWASLQKVVQEPNKPQNLDPISRPEDLNPKEIINFDYLGNLLRIFAYQEFAKSVVKWPPLTEESFMELLSSHWHPRDYSNAQLLITLLTPVLEASYIQRLKGALLRGEISCPAEIPFDYMIKLMTQITALVKDLSLTRTQSFPARLDPHRKQNLVATIDQMERYLFVHGVSEDELSLVDLLEELRQCLSPKQQRKQDSILDRIRSARLRRGQAKR